MLQLAGSGIIKIQNFKWDRVSHPSCTSYSFCCEKIAHDAWNITNVQYDLSLASHEAVALSLPEHPQTKSFLVLTMCAVFYLILQNAIKEDLPVADAIYSVIQPCWGSCLFELDHDI